MNLKTAEAKEKTILVGIEKADSVPVAESLAELYQLARTAGAKVEAKLIQKREKPHRATYIGTGKALELKEYVQSMGVNMVVVDDELTPTQESNLEDTVGCKVIDRTRLILDIFAMHASTSVGKLQVELAQLEYFLPRLKNIWTDFSRLGGGIGTRGPGEKKIDVDRSQINDRIVAIRRKLEKISSKRRDMRKKRKKEFKKHICLVGYTNSGKSTLLNQMTHDTVGTANKLFSTLSAKTRKLNVSDYEVFITDTVGFIRKLPHQVVEAFMATLQLVQEADILVHVIDFSSEHYRHQMESVNEVLAELDSLGKPMIRVYNKIDKISRAPGVKSGDIPSVFISAAEGTGIELLKEEIIKTMEKEMKTIELEIPQSRQDVINSIYKNSKVISRCYEGNSIIIKARMDKGPAKMLSRYAVK